MMAHKILIICHANIGDLCYDLSVIKPLRAHFPDSHIAILASSRAAGLADGYQGIDEIITFDKKGKDSGWFGRWRMMMQLICKRFHLAVVLKHTHMYKFLLVREAWPIHDFSLEPETHCADSYCSFLRSHGVAAVKPVFAFGISEKAAVFRDQFLSDHGIGPGKKIVGILPLAAWLLKCWPMEKWKQLAATLREKHNVVILAFGDSDNAEFKRFVFPLASSDILLTGKTSLPEALALVERCDVFIGPDSSLLHIASCMGTPVVGLYGATPADFVYPYFHRDHLVSNQHPRPCQPCYPIKKTFICKDQFFGLCMEDISVDVVVQAVEEVLNLPLGN